MLSSIFVVALRIIGWMYNLHGIKQYRQKLCETKDISQQIGYRFIVIHTWIFNQSQY